MTDIFYKDSFICDTINDLTVQFRKDILQMIYNSQYRNKLKEKGNGTQIKLSDLPPQLIDKIYTFMIQKLNDQKINFI
jgi:hypothetical protein